MILELILKCYWCWNLRIWFEELFGERDFKEKLSVFWDCLVEIFLFNFDGSFGLVFL